MQDLVFLLSLGGALMTSLANMADALSETGSDVDTRCPKVCFCNSASQIVYCSRRGLAAIPPGVPADTLQLNLNGNQFALTTVTRSNLSAYVRLEHLYLSECGLEAIEVGAFFDLADLRWLDLSNNRIKALAPRTFDGLTLQHLFVNGNRNIRIFPESFAGLATTGLYLHDCSLTSLDADAVVPLNFTLRYLWLNGNELERLDPRLRQLFDVLLHLRLGLNPLRCNCWAVWIKEFFDRAPEVFKGALPPTCFRPDSLKGRQFRNLTVHDLRCQAPMFNEVEATFDADTSSGRLTCVASGDPAPVLYWVQPSGRATRYGAPPTPASPPDLDLDPDELGLNEAVLELGQLEGGVSRQAGMYICVADNDAGNATLTISLPSPHPPPNDAAQGESSKRPVNMVNRVQSFDHDDDEYSVADVDVVVKSSSRHATSKGGRSEGRFTVAELTWAVIGTHLSTLVLCLLIAAALCLRSRRLEDLKDVDRSAADDLDDLDVSRHVRHYHCYSPTRAGNTIGGGAGGSDVIKKTPDMTSETVYLRLNGMHPYRCAGSYFSDTTTSAVSITR